jgi:hypothetical protein
MDCLEWYAKYERADQEIEQMRKDIDLLKELADASMQDSYRWSKLMELKPLKEVVEYLYEGDMIDNTSDPEYCQFLIESEGQFNKDHKKYQEDVMALGKRRFEVDFEEKGS